MSAVKYCHRRCESVDEVLPANGPKLASAKCSAERDGAKEFLDRFGIVIWPFEQRLSATVARKDQGRARMVDVHQRCAEVFIGRFSISHLELNGLADFHAVADRNATAIMIRTENGSDQEVSAMKFGLVFVDHKTDVKARCEQFALIRCNKFNEFHQARECGFASEFGDEVRFAVGNDKGFTDGAASLGNDRGHIDALECNTHGTAIVDISID